MEMVVITHHWSYRGYNRHLWSLFFILEARKEGKMYKQGLIKLSKSLKRMQWKAKYKRQMILQYLQNAGSEGAKRDSIFEYVKDVLPNGMNNEQKLRKLGKLLVQMEEENLITTIGRKWQIRS